MLTSITCPVCKTTYNKQYTYCPECGCNLSVIDAVSVTVTPSDSSESLSSSIKNRVHEIGKRAQKGISDVSSVISDKAGEVSFKASNVVVEEKVVEAMGNLVNLMINVSKELLTQTPAEMVNSIDLKADINFIAFTVGVIIDLKELKGMKKTRQASSTRESIQ